MAGLCEGRVVIVTGGARGIGREHCLEFARQGARIVVNDLGSERTGEGRSSEPAEALAAEIRAMRYACKRSMAVRRERNWLEKAQVVQR